MYEYKEDSVNTIFRNLAMWCMITVSQSINVSNDVRKLYVLQ
jgi:hypothetical protein